MPNLERYSSVYTSKIFIEAENIETILIHHGWDTILTIDVHERQFIVSVLGDINPLGLAEDSAAIPFRPRIRNGLPMYRNFTVRLFTSEETTLDVLSTNIAFWFSPLNTHVLLVDGTMPVATWKVGQEFTFLQVLQTLRLDYPFIMNINGQERFVANAMDYCIAVGNTIFDMVRQQYDRDLQSVEKGQGEQPSFASMN